MEANHSKEKPTGAIEKELLGVLLESAKQAKTIAKGELKPASGFMMNGSPDRSKNGQPDSSHCRQ